MKPEGATYKQDTEINQIEKNFSSQEKLFEMFGDSKRQSLSFERLICFLNQSYEGILLADAEGRIFYATDAVERITGFSNLEIIGRTPEEMKAQGLILSQSLKVLKKNPLTIVQKLRTGREVFTTSRPVVDKQGKTICYISNFRDIAELTQLHQEHHLQRDIDYTELQELRSRVLAIDSVINNSSLMKRVIEKAWKVAQTCATVLIIGESGVGKEVIAKIIHNLSSRANQPYIQINCGAIPDSLMEAELFGYEKGSFTGAERSKAGLLEVANEGTVLLDEIGEIPLHLQVKLLRVIQTNEFYRVGGTNPRKLNVRFLAATNRDLKKMVEIGEFREDLYYRLHVVPIEIPPLRERKEDIIPLACYFLDKNNQKYGTRKKFDPETSQLMERYDWPGNVRQLENTIERAVIMTEGNSILPSVLPEEVLQKIRPDLLPLSSLPQESVISLKKLREITEKEMISRALQQYGSIRTASKYLEVDHSTLVKKIQKYGISKSGGKNQYC